jgi:hypothetical protein
LKKYGKIVWGKKVRGKKYGGISTGKKYWRIVQKKSPGSKKYGKQKVREKSTDKKVREKK